RQGPEPLLSEADPGEVQADGGVAPAGRLEHAVPGVPRQADADEGRQVRALLVEQVDAGARVDAGDLVLADAVEGVPAGVIPERMAEANVPTEGVAGVMAEDASVVEAV